MDYRDDQLNQLLSRLETLLKKQDLFFREIEELRHEINQLKQQGEISAPPPEHKEEIKPSLPIENISSAPKEINLPPQGFSIPASKQPNLPPPGFSPPPSSPKGRSDIEKFIGENLINKIGIAITVIGVSIGAKYAIDHELITPLTRIILGYLVGAGLMFFAVRLKKNYKNFSAVLLSGAMAIFYFITFAAYSLYSLMPQAAAFSLMVLFTAFTVAAAIHYNLQVIAHVGLVGAYAVPLLLSDGSGKVAILFSYMAIINAGILFIAFKKYWQPLYYASFILTWLIYMTWFFSKYDPALHFSLSLIFLSVFFITFYITFLAYKLSRKEKFVMDDIILLLFNSFFFYGIGYSVLSDHKTGEQLLGLYTAFNALIHFGVSTVIYRNKLADRNLFFFTAGLVLVFITLAIPVQLEGNWVTLTWAGEAALLFWIGRTKAVPVYEKLSYPLMALAFFSLLQDWTWVYDAYDQSIPATRITPLLNVNFLSSLLFIGTFSFITVLMNSKKYVPAFSEKNIWHQTVSFSVPAILLVVVYFSLRLEITTYWLQLFKDSEVSNAAAGEEYGITHWDYDLLKFNTLWLINYSLLFFSLLSWINIRKIKNTLLAQINAVFLALAILFFLIQGLYLLSELRESYLTQEMSEYYQRMRYHIFFRYICYFFAGKALLTLRHTLKSEIFKSGMPDVKTAFEGVLYFVILWAASSELLHWLDLNSYADSYKLALSILWGLYSLLMIILGIWKKKKHLRIGAISLFGITLLKLFFYDIAHLDTISKTIVFVSLGILLLIISFLYNKYKHIIGD